MSWREWPNRELPDGRLLALEPLLFGAFRLHVVGDPDGIRSTEVYEYQDAAKARHALMYWNGEDEPRGWYRHRPSNRRRPNGDPMREHIAE